jgi:hypothetical protein
MLKQILAAAAALALAAPVAAQAQTVPSYAYAQNDQQIQGRVASFDGAYGLTVTDNNGYVDNVALHDGTIINPTGLTLEPGMIVDIVGYNAGAEFDANEIDTPYTFDDAIPYYAGHPWNYYGPSFGLSFFFGNTGWWHAGYRGVAYDPQIRERHVTNVTIDRTNYVSHENDVSHDNDANHDIGARTTAAPARSPSNVIPRYRAVNAPSHQGARGASPARAGGEQHVRR